MQDQPTSFDFQRANQFVAAARDAFVASGESVGPTVQVAFDRSSVTAFRAENGRVRFEVVQHGGNFFECSFQGAARHFAASRARFFAAR